MKAKDIWWWQGMQGGVPSTYPAVLDDGNTVAWFDSAENITKDGSDLVSVWGDKSGLNHYLLQETPANQPLWSADGVTFFNQNMKCAAFTLAQPEMIYIVMKQITWTSIDYFFDGNSANTGLVLQSNTAASPNIYAYAGTASDNSSDLALDTFGILRVLFNGASSKLIVNDNTPITGNFGASDMGGFTLAANGSAVSESHIGVKEVIIRKVADGATDEAAIYAYLASKYSIT